MNDPKPIAVVDTSVSEKWGRIMQDLELDISFMQEGAEVCVAECVSREEKQKRYAALVEKSEALVVKFRQNFDGGCIDRRSILRKIRAGDEYIYLTPQMGATGGFASMYYHFVFGLFFNRILRDVSHPDVEFNILCQGRGYPTGDMWWRIKDTDQYDTPDWHKRIVQMCMKSPDFQKLNDPRQLDDSKHIRTVVWMCRNGHAFAVGWDLTKSGGLVSGNFFFIDCNEENKFAFKIASEFKDRIKENFEIEGELTVNPKSIILLDEVDASAIFPCVPFLVRSTLYISLVEQISTSSDISPIIDAMEANGEPEMDFSLRIYLRFEELLLNIAESIISKGNLLLLPSHFAQCTFVNIKSVCLMSYDTNTGKVNGKYYFQGFNSGFVKLRHVDIENPSDCAVICSRFPSLVMLRSLLASIDRVLLRT